MAHYDISFENLTRLIKRQPLIETVRIRNTPFKDESLSSMIEFLEQRKKERERAESLGRRQEKGM